MSTSHREIQTSIDQCRQFNRRVLTSEDECRRVIDKCRQTQTNVDESKTFSLIPEKNDTCLILLLLQVCNSRPQRYANFQFCNFICVYCSSQFFYSSDQQNLFHLMFVNSNCIDAQKSRQGKILRSTCKSKPRYLKIRFGEESLDTIERIEKSD